MKDQSGVVSMAIMCHLWDDSNSRPFKKQATDPDGLWGSMVETEVVEYDIVGAVVIQTRRWRLI